jgi:hypothetical protein
MNEPKRNPAALQKLEELQAGFHAEAGRSRDDVDFPNKIPDMAHMEVTQEFLTRMGKLSGPESIQTSIMLLKDPKYEAAVNARIADLKRRFEVGDGDIWSKYERLDHRRRLIELVMRVESAARKRGDRIPFRPVVGTLPTRDINAKAYPGPSAGGDIVAFETGMFMFTDVLARVVALSLTVRDPAETRPLTFDKKAVVAHIERHPGILLDFADLIFSQTFLGTCQYTDKRCLPEGFRVEETHRLLHDAADTFILAHEYGHVIMGHPSIGKSGSDADRVRHEFEADETGLQITLAAFDDSKWAYAGAVLFLVGVAIVEMAKGVLEIGKPMVKIMPSHPSPQDRLRKLAASLPRLVAPSASLPANELAEMVKWLLADLWGWFQRAFEMAHRDGFTGRLSVNIYYEKQSHLYAFLGAAFGFDSAGFQQKIIQQRVPPGAIFDTLNAELLPLLVAAFHARPHLQ